MPNYCPKCAAQNDDTSRFCRSCGSALMPDGGYPNVESQDQPQGYTPSFSYTAPAQPQPYEPYQANVPQSSFSQSAAGMAENSRTGKLSMVSMVMGIVVASLMIFGLIPCLGWINWFTLMIGGVSKLIGWISVFTEHKIPGALNKAIIGLVLSTIALFVGGIRLAMGGGCI